MLNDVLSAIGGVARAVAEPPSADEAKAKAKAVEAFRKAAAEKSWIVVEEAGILPPIGNLNPKRQEDGIITYTYEGKTYAVSAALTPFKYTILNSKLNGTEIERKDNDIAVDVPESSTTDFMYAETTVDGKTVGELFYDNMKNEWGKLDLSDPRRQYYELLQAQSALNNGYAYLPYETKASPFSGSSTYYLENGAVMDQASTYGLLKEEEVADKLSKLSANPEVAKGVDGFMEDAASKMKDRRGVAEKVFETLSSQEYKDLLLKMDPEAAKIRLNNDLESLRILDTGRASQVRDNFLSVGLTQEIADIATSGEFDPEAFDLAIRDVIQLGLGSTFASIFSIDLASSAAQAYLKRLEGGDLSIDAKNSLTPDQQRALQSYHEARRIAGDAYKNSLVGGVFNQQEFLNRIEAGLRDATLKDGRAAGAAALLHAAFSNGALVAGGGILALTAAVYTMNKNNLGETMEERMAVARGLLVFVATLPDAAKFLTGLIGPGASKMLGFSENTQLNDQIKKLFPKAAEDPIPLVDLPGQQNNAGNNSTLDNYRSAISQQSGDTTFQNAIGDAADRLANNQGVPPADWADNLDGELTELFDEGLAQQNAAINEAADNQNPLNNLTPDEQQRAVNNANQNLMDRGVDATTVDSTSKYRFIGTTVKVVSGLGDLAGGILDITLGALSIDKLRKDPNATDVEKAAASLQVVSGVSLTGAAFSGLAGMLTTTGSALATGFGIAGGVLGIAGIALGFFAAIVSGIVAKQKQDGKAEEIRQDFRDWEALGVTEENWGDKLNYVIHSRHAYDEWYGSDKYYDFFPEDKPVWEARAEQYEEFTSVVHRDGHLVGEWFTNWDRTHNAEIQDVEPQPPEFPRLGDNRNAENFDKFKREIEKVDVSSIRIEDDGRVTFVKDGKRMEVDPVFGEHTSPIDRRKIIDYLTDLHDLIRPNGTFDQGLADKVTQAHDKSDRYNEIADLKRLLSDDTPMFGKDRDDGDKKSKVGSFKDFKRDVNRVDIGSIELDPTDSSVIYFVKDGQRWKLDRDDSGDLGKAGTEIFDYLKNIYTLTHPNGERDQERIDRIDEAVDKNDKTNEISGMKALFGIKQNADTSGALLYGSDRRTGSFNDFKRDADLIDIETIRIEEDGRVFFVKNGQLQVVNPSDPGNVNRKQAEEVARYLEDLHDLARPGGVFDEERARRINELLGGSDDYNEIDKLRNKLEIDADALGLPVFGDGGKPGSFKDFRKEIEKVDIGQIEVLEDGRVIFVKNGVKQVVSPTEGDKASQDTRLKIIEYLKGLYDLTHPDGQRSQERIDRLQGTFKATDIFNDLESARALIENSESNHDEYSESILLY